MPTEVLANYLNRKRVERGLTYEAVATISNIPESTVKNLCLGKTANPQIDTIIPVIEAVGGSLDEMFFPEKTKDEVKGTSILALKDVYEFQLAEIKRTNEEHIHNIRLHYEQHHEDLRENYEKRLADKREIIESSKEYIKSLKKECFSSRLAFWICVSVFIMVLILEVMNPNLGWFRF